MSAGSGCSRVTSQWSLAAFSASAISSGWNLAMARATIRSMVIAPNPWARSASWSSTNAAASTERAVVASATRRAFHNGTVRSSTWACSLGSRHVQVQRVGHQAGRGLGGHPERGTQRGRGVGGDHRGARTAHRQVAARPAHRARLAPVRGLVGVGHGVQLTPLQRQPQLAASAARSCRSHSAARSRQAAASRSSTS